jgi:hypothetical protein
MPVIWRSLVRVLETHASQQLQETSGDAVILIWSRLLFMFEMTFHQAAPSLAALSKVSRDSCVGGHVVHSCAVTRPLQSASGRTWWSYNQMF